MNLPRGRNFREHLEASGNFPPQVSRTTEAELLAKGAGEVDRKRCWKDAAADGQQVQAYQALKYPSVK